MKKTLLVCFLCFLLINLADAANEKERNKISDCVKSKKGGSITNCAVGSSALNYFNRGCYARTEVIEELWNTPEVWDMAPAMATDMKAKLPLKFVTAFLDETCEMNKDECDEVGIKAALDRAITACGGAGPCGLLPEMDDSTEAYA